VLLVVAALGNAGAQGLRRRRRRRRQALEEEGRWVCRELLGSRPAAAPAQRAAGGDGQRGGAILGGSGVIWRAWQPAACILEGHGSCSISSLVYIPKT